MSAVAGVGGTVGVSRTIESAIAEMNMELDVELSLAYNVVWFIGNNYRRFSMVRCKLNCFMFLAYKVK